MRTPHTGSPPTRLIAAWGNETAVAYHGASRRAKGSVVLFGSGEEGQEGQGGAENDTSAGGRVASTASGAEGPDAGGAELINDKWFDVAPVRASAAEWQIRACLTRSVI